MPAVALNPPQVEEAAQEKAPLKAQTRSAFAEEKEKKLKRNFDNEANWNYLFMNADAVNAAMADQLNITKGELLDREKDNLAVRVATSESIIVNKTKEWMKEQGIDVKVLENSTRLTCERN